MNCPSRVGVAAVLSIAGAAAAQPAEVFWANPNGGVWSIASNWSPAIVPNNSGDNLFNATLDLQSQPYSVLLNIDVTLENFSLLWGGATLDLGSSDFTVNQDLTISAGTLTRSGSGATQVDGTFTLDDATLFDAGDITSSGLLTLSGKAGVDICNTGVDHRGAEGISFTGQGDLTIDQGGSLTNGDASTFRISSDGNRTVTGDGTGSLVNQGDLVQGAESRGLLGLTSISQVQFFNPGTVSVIAGGLVLDPSNDLVVEGELGEGTWNVSNGSFLDLVKQQVQSLGGTVNISGPNSSFNAVNTLTDVLQGGRFSIADGKDFTPVGPFTNNGELEVGPQSFFDASEFSLGNFDGSGLFGGRFIVAGTLATGAESITQLGAEIFLKGRDAQILNAAGRDALTSLTLVEQGSTLKLLEGAVVRVQNDLRVEGQVTVEGSLTEGPGRVVDPDGTAIIGGCVIFTETSTLELIFNGVQPDFYGQVIADCAEAQDGSTLQILVNPGVQFQVGQTFDLLVADQFAGAFTNLQGLDLGTGLSFEILQGPDGVTARIVPTLCPVDLVPDGVLNFFDVSAFIQAFTAQDPIADFTNDGLFDFFDVSTFIVLFGRGCD